MTTALPTTEKAWQRTVVDAARHLGWATYHTYLSVRSAPGFPDLVLCRDRVVFVEIKAQRGKLSAAQEEWIGRLRTAGAEVYVFRPSDWDEVLDVLRRREAASP